MKFTHSAVSTMARPGAHTSQGAVVTNPSLPPSMLPHVAV